jgi:hypothetical protein
VSGWYVRNSNGDCVLISNCNPTTHEMVNGVCTEKCPTGYTRNSAGNCIINICASNQEKINGICVAKCTTGFHRELGNCVQDTPTNCPIGTKWNGTSCVIEASPTIPTWALWVGGALVAGLIVFNVVNAVRRAK